MVTDADASADSVVGLVCVLLAEEVDYGAGAGSVAV